MQTLTVDRIETAIHAQVVPVRVPWAYRVRLLLVAVAVLLLPAVYLAIIATIGWAVAWWWQHGEEQAQDIPDVFVYVFAVYGPLAVGSFVVLALIKPLFRRSPAVPTGRVLQPDEEPALHALVHRVADEVGAPRPRRIAVDLSINASASLGQRLHNVVFTDMTLTLGLPLVRCMSVAELSAVIAHELGHFAQGAGLRAYFLIQHVNAWFARTIHGRDALDDALSFASGETLFSFGWLGVPLLAARIAVGIARTILMVLMYAAQVPANALSRQIEFDADAQAVRIAGTEAFASGMSAVVLAEAAEESAAEALRHGLDRGTLADDWPALIEVCTAWISVEETQRLMAQAIAAQPVMYASHPPTGQRLARARSMDAPCGVEIAAPAAALFADLDRLSRELTARHHGDLLKGAFERAAMTPSRVVAEAAAADFTRQSAIEPTFGEHWEGIVLLPGPPRVLPVKSSPQVKQAGDWIAAQEEFGEALLAFEGLDMLDCNKLLRDVMGRANVEVDDDFYPAPAEHSPASAAERLGALDPFAPALWRRVAEARARLRKPRDTASTQLAARLASSLDAGLDALHVLGEVREQAFGLRRSLHLLEHGGQVLMGIDDWECQRELQTLCAELRAAHVAVLEGLGDRTFPFPHAEGPIRMRDALPASVEGDVADVGEVHQAAMLLQDSLSHIFREAMGYVAETVGQVEREPWLT